ncbi:MAG: hypothetical protein KAH21_02750, partial [Spirochaetaceae bacterium]|nr:hypothetical protein [Spirochaetaceae bacterium]
RADGDYQFLFNLPKSTTLIALRNNKPVGYLMVSRSINKPGLVEAGGEKTAVETLIHKVLSGLEGEKKMTVYDNLTPTVLGALFEEKLPERRYSITATGMMIRINNLFSLMKSLIPHLERANAGAKRAFSLGITDSAELISFKFSTQGLELGRSRLDEHFELSLQELTAIVFGAHSGHSVTVPDVLKELFPFYFPIWQLDHS